MNVRNGSQSSCWLQRSSDSGVEGGRTLDTSSALSSKEHMPKAEVSGRKWLAFLLQAIRLDFPSFARCKVASSRISRLIHSIP